VLEDAAEKDAEKASVPDEEDTFQSTKRLCKEPGMLSEVVQLRGSRELLV
jgi:hypothetical protein